MSYKYETITSTPVSTYIKSVDVSQWLRVDNSNESLIIDLLINTAFSNIESMTNRLFLPRTMVLYTGELENVNNYPYIKILYKPCNTITTLHVMVDGVYTLVDTSYYTKDINSDYSGLFITYPITFDTDVTLPFKVSFTAGMSSIPDDIKLAIYTYVAFLYENRGDVPSYGDQTIPVEIYSVINKYRTISVL